MTTFFMAHPSIFEETTLPGSTRSGRGTDAGSKPQKRRVEGARGGGARGTASAWTALAVGACASRGTEGAGKAKSATDEGVRSVRGFASVTSVGREWPQSGAPSLEPLFVVPEVQG